MKKRILALLLAGLLTASMASCISKEGDENNTNDRYTNENTDSNGDVLPTPDQFLAANDTINTTGSVFLRVDITTTEGAVQVPVATELHRTGTTASWSRVEYNGAQYYVSNTYVTTDDLTGKTFTPCEQTVMYATDNVNIRTYASSGEFSPKIEPGLKANDTVIVIAKGEKWYKILHTTQSGTVECFVFASYLSVTPVQTVNTDYSKYFDECTPTNMYICTDHANIRKAPSKEENIGIIAGSLNQNDVVTVVKRGKDEYKDWVVVKVADKVTPGDPQTYSEFYIHTSCLSPYMPGSETTLDDMLRVYTAFEGYETARTMYVLKGSTVNMRRTPDFNADDNKVGQLTELQAVTVVASGTADGIYCYMIKDGKGNFYFVSAKYLTTDPNGNVALSLQDILKQYTAFKACKERTVKSIAVANCYVVPQTQGVTPSTTIAAGVTVTMVATGQSAGAEWYVIRTADSVYYFVGANLFANV